MNYLDMSMPPEVFLLNRINDLYNRDWTFKQIYFDREGVVEVDQYGCDSMIRIHARPGCGFTGSLRVFYNRVNFDSYLSHKILFVEWKKYFDTDDLLPLVKQKLGINLRRGDIISDIIDPEAESTVIRLSKRCLAYKGNIKVAFANHPNSLAARIQNRDLNGFNL